MGTVRWGAGLLGLLLACGGGGGPESDPSGDLGLDSGWEGEVPGDPGGTEDGPADPGDAGPADGAAEEALDPGGDDPGTVDWAPRDPGFGPDHLPEVPFDPPPCGSGQVRWSTLIPGPGQPGHDADLAAKAEAYDRVWTAFHAAAMHLNTDVTISLDAPEDRQRLADFAATPGAWDFEAFAGRPPLSVIASQHKVAGLYAGDGVAADAYRYMVLRDQGAPCDEVRRAREWLLGDLEALHVVVAITGAPGVIARGIARTDLPGDGQNVTVVPLFDDQGNPLPPVKNNGTWRRDFSGLYPDLVWEDSISRDMYIGWVAGYAAAWEAIRDDPDIPGAAKDRLREDALAVARQLQVVRPSGYDLEIPDADGRTTLHGWINEHNLDGVLYGEEIRNGFHAMMALGIVAAWVFVTEDPGLKAWLYGELIAGRRLHEIARDELYLVDMGLVSNYSNYNMAFQGAWLAMRYLADDEARQAVRLGLEDGMYARPGQSRQPAEFAYSLYDFIHAHGAADGSFWWPADGSVLDRAALDRGIRTLREFPAPPYWNFGVEQCPQAHCTESSPQVEDPDCLATDGVTRFTALGCVGRNGDLVTLEPIPMRLLGPSNFHWRSNPYQPNREGDGSALLPGVDFRLAYWMGRHFRVGSPGAAP